MITKKEAARLDNLLPGGIPRWIRCYDNGGESADRYTVVFTGRFPYTQGWHPYIGMSSDPYYPQGVGIHGDAQEIIDKPTYGHLGKKIKFTDLNDDCKRMVLDQYVNLWDLMPHIIKEGQTAETFENPYQKDSIEWHAYNNGWERKV